MSLIFIGCGGVGSALLEVLNLQKELKYYKSIIVIDETDHKDPIFDDLQIEVIRISVNITADNIMDILSLHTRKGDLIVDVSYNIYFEPIIDWCLDKGITYINTSIERWPLINEHLLTNLYERTLQYSHNIVMEKKKHNHKGLVMLEHGMNPGLISYFTKMAIRKITEEVIKCCSDLELEKDLTQALYKEDYAKLSYILKLETIHCSERDTQESLIPRTEDLFLNTWGSYSLYSESVDPIQLGYGTHEDFPFDVKKDNQIFLNKRGMDVKLESYVPSPSDKEDIKNNIIQGYLIPHGENNTISRSLTYKSGDILYRPSNYYVYNPCLDAISSLNDVKSNNYLMLNNQKSVRGYQINKGYDAVGALLFFNNKDSPVKNKGSYWCGTILSIDDTRKLGIKYAGPTTVQVAISLLLAIRWARKSHQTGIYFPEDLPYSIFDELLNQGIPWLGKIFNDWTPYTKADNRIQSFIVDKY